MIILRSRVQGRGKFIAKPAALTKQFTVMLEILKTYEFLWSFCFPGQVDLPRSLEWQSVTHAEQESATPLTAGTSLYHLL